jgi:ADP-ribose pyrophosphatase
MLSTMDPQVVFRSGAGRWASKRFALVEETFDTPDGTVTKPVIHHPGAVVVLAQPDPTTVVLVRQYRYALRAWTWEVPAGTREPGEDPAVTAGRELAEEAGFTAARLIELLRFHPAPGVSDEEMVLYRAEGLSATATHPDHGELVEPRIVSLHELPHLLASAPRDAKTLIALMLGGLLAPGSIR